jgi:hypothetical protein
MYKANFRFVSSILLVFSILIVSQVGVLAGHSFNVPTALVCKDGAKIVGTAGGASLNLLMTSQIMDAGGITVLATGNTYTFTFVGETFNFTISYPVGTIAVGTTVQASISDIPGTNNGNNGDFLVTTVQDYLLTPVSVVPELVPLDSRINRFDSAAPIAVYAVDGSLEIFTIDSESNGTFAFTVSASEIEAVGVSGVETLITSQSGINVSRLSDGRFLITAATSNGKTYVLIFDSVGVLTDYTSYESD